jgi:predicted TIM-barrel fold metal-dependent hydrolase
MIVPSIVAFDADGHIFEDDSEIFEYLPEPFHGHRELLRSSLFPPMDSWNRTALAISGQYKEGAATEHFREAGYNVTAESWLRFLDTANLEGTVLYPTSALGFARIKEIDWAIALARAYNDWIYNRFVKASTRINAMALIPFQDPEAGARELRRAVLELGMVGGVMVAGHRLRPFGDLLYDPIYRAAEELDTVIAIHAGGPGNRFEIFERAIEARCLGHPTSLMIEMTSMMFNGVFDRFPNVRFSFMEGGVGWVLFLRDRMHEAYEQWAVQAPALKKDPDEHLCSGRIYFHCELDERILPCAVSILGDHVLLYASDFPHIAPERVIEHKQHFLERKDLSLEAKTNILRNNALRLYKLSSK